MREMDGEMLGRRVPRIECKYGRRATDDDNHSAPSQQRVRGAPPPNTAPRATVHGSWVCLGLGPPCWCSRVVCPLCQLAPSAAGLSLSVTWGGRQRGWPGLPGTPLVPLRPPRSAHQLALHPCNFPGPPLRQCKPAANRPAVCVAALSAPPTQPGAAWLAVWFVNIPEHPPCLR